MLKKILISFFSVVLIFVIVYFSLNTKIIKFKVIDENITKRQVKLKKKYLSKPKVNLDNNFIIEGWYKDKDFINEWIFEADKVYKNTTLYAKVLETINANIYRDDQLVSNFIYLNKEEYQPLRLGYKFLGLYFDNDFNEPLDYDLTKSDENITLYEKWELEERNIPIMTIDIDKDINDVNRDDYNDAKVSLFNLEEEYELDNLDAHFRGRGNSSWEKFDKKGFKLKFDKKQSLFGKAKNKHYALVAEGYDTTLTKNKVAYTLGAKVLSNIEYSTEAHLIDLYINKEYYGIYILIEHRRVGKGRVDIESEYGEIDTGYLLEYDARAAIGNIEGIDYFTIPQLRHPFLVKYPKPKNYESKGNITELEFRSQIFFIQSYLKEALEALYSGDKELIDQYFDIPSVVDMYILQEYIKNYDSGWSSQYMYKKPGGKLYFGPPWDFDITAGSNYFPGLKSFKGLYVSNNSSLQPIDHKNQMYISLMENDWFIKLVKDRLIELEDEILETIENIYKNIYTYNESFHLNYLRWPDITDAKIDPANYLLEQELTEQWYYNRLDWLMNWARE